MNPQEIARLARRLEDREKAIDETLAELARFQNYSALDMRNDDAQHVDRLKRRLRDQHRTLETLELLLAATLVEE